MGWVLATVHHLNIDILCYYDWRFQYMPQQYIIYIHTQREPGEIDNYEGLHARARLWARTISVNPVGRWCQQNSAVDRGSAPTATRVISPLTNNDVKKMWKRKHPMINYVNIIIIGNVHCTAIIMQGLTLCVSTYYTTRTLCNAKSKVSVCNYLNDEILKYASSNKIVFIGITKQMLTKSNIVELGFTLIRNTKKETNYIIPMWYI